MSIQQLGTWCSECGPNVACDEDGCCAGCGRDAVGDGADEALAIMAEYDYLLERIEVLGDIDTANAPLCRALLADSDRWRREHAVINAASVLREAAADEQHPGYEAARKALGLQ